MAPPHRNRRHPTRSSPAKAQHTVSVRLFLPFLRLLDDLEPATLEAVLRQGEASLARWGVTRTELEADYSKRLPVGLLVDMLHGFVELVGDPALPLRAGLKLEVGDYELIEYLASSCATLGEAIRCVGRYYGLLGPADLTLHVHDDHAEARFTLLPGIDAPPAVYEFATASNFVMSVLHIQLEGVELPLEVRFKHGRPAHAAAYDELFQVPVRFGWEHNSIVFSRRMASQPMAKPDPGLHAVLARLADLELAALGGGGAFPDKVCAMIERELRDGAPLDAVAARLHMSPSTLRSRLSRYGTSYSALLDRIRREHTQRALRRSDVSFAEIAHALGFAHPPAFHRAVRRWFGATPGALRDAPTAHPIARFLRAARAAP